MIIEGAISVKAAILNGKREVLKVYIDSEKKTKDFHFIRRICAERSLEILESDKQTIASLASGKSHGGVLAEVGTRKNDELEEGDIFYLDGIEDPFNLGYSFRTMYALGVKNVLLSKRDYSNMEPQLLKSSAGAYDMLNIRVCDDPYAQIKALKENSYHLYGMYRSADSKDIFDVNFCDKALFMLGGEKRGISADLLELCDEHLFISYGSDFRNALNACGALDVAVTLLRAQRRK